LLSLSLLLLSLLLLLLLLLLWEPIHRRWVLASRWPAGPLARWRGIADESAPTPASNAAQEKGSCKGSRKQALHHADSCC